MNVLKYSELPVEAKPATKASRNDKQNHYFSPKLKFAAVYFVTVPNLRNESYLSVSVTLWNHKIALVEYIDISRFVFVANHAFFVNITFLYMTNFPQMAINHQVFEMFSLLSC